MSIARPAEAASSESSQRAAALTVGLGPRAYDVLVGSGLLPEAASLLHARFGRARCAIVTDENVATCHLAPLQAGLRSLGVHAGTKVLPVGETTKSFGALQEVCEALLEMGLERSSIVVALGGGVIGDLAGLAASLLRRGVRYVQIPTTLLAQVDSSVGGKTGINTAHGKNLIGTFHQPSLVIADIDVLATLPPRQFRAGYAEVVKYGLLGDVHFFDWLEGNWRAVFAKKATLEQAISTCVRAKADIVARDETESGERMLLNLGHTFGHALEAWTGFSDRLLHGEAVAIGMCLAFQLSGELGLTARESIARVEAHLRDTGLPTTVAEIRGGELPSAATLLEIMAQDKKVRDGKLTLILARGIGEAFIMRDVSSQLMLEFLTRRLAAAHTAK